MKKSLACFLLVLVIVGCGSGVKPPPKTFLVTGTVTYNDAPVRDATVSFWGPKSPIAGAAVTNESGEFRLSTTEGENQITITKIVNAPKAVSADVLNKDPSKLAEMNTMPPAEKKAFVNPSAKGKRKVEPPQPKPPVPDKYASVKSTPLNETVSSSGKNNFAIKLTD